MKKPMWDKAKMDAQSQISAALGGDPNNIDGENPKDNTDMQLMMQQMMAKMDEMMSMMQGKMMK